MSRPFKEQKDAYFCVINPRDDIYDLTDEIDMRVASATQFMLDKLDFE